MLHRKQLTTLMIWEMLSFSHQFPIAWENVTKPIVWENLGNWQSYFSHSMVTFFPSYGILHHMGNAWVFPSISHSTRKCNKTHRMGENLGNWQSYFSHSMGTFFPSDSYPMVYFIIWEMHGFSHQFPIARKNPTKPIIWGGPGKLVLILFP